MADNCFWPTPAKRGRPPRRPPLPTPQPTVKILPAAAPLDAAGAAVSVPPPQPLELEAAPMARPTTTTSKKRRRQQGGDEQGFALDDGETTATATAAADLGSATTALLANTVAGLKADMRAMTAKMKKMEKKVKKQGNNDVVVELQRRVGQVEEDNAQLRIQLAHVAASRYGIAATTAAPSLFSSAQQQQQRLRVGDTGQLGPEMLWCFPFLQHYDIPADRFVVDDIQKAIAIVRQPGTGRHISFANHQLCSIVGFSMVELLGRQILSVSSLHEKHKLRHALLTGGQMGYSESTPCFLQLECKGGHFAKVASRVQFFFGADAQLRYSVLCVDQVLGVDLVPFTIEEARKKEEAEWEMVFQSSPRDRDDDDDDGTSSSLAPPSASPAACAGLCDGEDYLFGDFISSSSSPSATRSETMPPPNRQT